MLPHYGNMIVYMIMDKLRFPKGPLEVGEGMNSFYKIVGQAVSKLHK